MTAESRNTASSRNELIQADLLVDLNEWARQRGVPPAFPAATVLTSALWEHLERIPFRLISSTSLDARVMHLIARARACLEPHGAVDTLTREVTLAFTASLPCRSEDPARQIFHLHFKPEDTSTGTLTIGLPHELPIRPEPGRV